MNYGEIIANSYKGFANYVWSEISFQTDPWYINYFYYLLLLSLVVWGLEIAFPWRKNQAIFRKDFWLDFFYMFFNFYIFKLIIFIAFSNVTAAFFENFDLSNMHLFDGSQWPNWVQFIVFFIAMDFIQWFTHVMLHKFEFLWKFHKVHHSVEEMGFAAHLRYHWMENVFYTPMKYIMLILIGNFDPANVFVIYYISIAIGHLNHANIKLSYGPLKYILNNPAMHIWHHAYSLPKDRSNGVNFGISLSIWDYIFKTAYIPESGRDIKLGFDDMDDFPNDFVHQNLYGFKND